MKKNKVLVYVHPDFRDVLKLEAKKKGMTIVPYTKDIISPDKEIQDIIKEWDKKLKKNNKPLFDFP